VATTDGLMHAGTFSLRAVLLRLERVRQGACEGLSSAEPVLVAVPGRRLNLVRGALGEAAGAVSFADIAVLGRNPAGSSRPSAGSPIAAARAAHGSSAGVAWRASV